MENEAPRIGVFICHCGSNIGGIVDCKQLVEYSSTLSGVVHAEDNMYTCSEVGLKQIKDKVEEMHLNRVVVASCTPRTHEPLFRETIQEVGLNPYLFEMVNIRDQCSWVHMKDPASATEKAQDLIRMGVAKAQFLTPLQKPMVDVTRAAAVIGGGIAGMTAAANLGDQGFKVYLLERAEILGGILNKLNKIAPTNELASDFLNQKLTNLQNNPNVEILTETTLSGVSGFVGNYELNVEKKTFPTSLKVGAIILATGAEVLPAKSVAEFAGNGVINQVDLEQSMIDGSFSSKDVVMIQCAGARNEERPYCSNICCMTALKNALLIRESSPETNVTVIYRDIQTLGTKYEAMYQKARESRVLFIKYDPHKLPIIKDESVVVYNELIGKEVRVPRDLIVLTTPLVAQPDSKQIGQFFKVPLGDNGFLLEAHVKLRPMDFATDGIYVCGSTRWPVDIPESIAQGYAAASRASTVLSHDTIEVEGAIANIPVENKNQCKGCEICVKVCPFGAIKKGENDEIEVISILCKGCGTCVATCPRKVLSVYHFTNEQILSQIHALGGRSAA